MVALTMAILFVCASAAVHAQDDDLPGRVGRVADVAGQLYLAPEDRPDEWATIGINYPVTTGDNLWVEGDGRAEIDNGGGQLRLAGGASVHVSRLDERALTLFVAQGRTIVRVRALAEGDSVRVDAPATQIDLMRAGLYRIDVDPSTQVVTLGVGEGEAYVWLAGMAQQALAGQTVTVRSESVAEIRTGLGIDGFDTWSADRDRAYDRNRSLAYVSPEMVGTYDLGSYGEWATYPDYGPVWFPNDVAPDWAPYSDGYWVSVGAWGPVWIDAAPWGYAPFHYGRWAHVHGRWGWCPGKHRGRPRWAPALVAWYGGPGWHHGGHRGDYGWVALGWGEPYTPGWRRCSDRCWTAYNRPYAVKTPQRPTTPPHQYVNATVPGAVTVVPGSALATSKPVAINRLRLPPDVAANAPVLGAPPQVKPLRAETSRVQAAIPPAASTIRMAKPPPMHGTPKPSVAVPARGQAPSSRPAPIIVTPESGGRVVATPPVRTLPGNVAPDAGASTGNTPLARPDTRPARNAQGSVPVPVPSAPAATGGATSAPGAPVYRIDGNAGSVSVPPRTGAPVAAPERGSLTKPLALPPERVAPAPIPQGALPQPTLPQPHGGALPRAVAPQPAPMVAPQPMPVPAPQVHPGVPHGGGAPVGPQGGGGGGGSDAGPQAPAGGGSGGAVPAAGGRGPKP